MYLPDLTEQQQETVVTSEFKGLNRGEVVTDGEMADMTNLSGRAWPTLTQRRKRGITSLDVSGQPSVPLNGIHGRDQLVFIRGTDVYYNLLKVVGISVSTSSNMLPKKIVSFGAYVCIWPDKVYFNTADLTDYGSMQRLYSVSGASVSMTMCRLDGTNYDYTQITKSATAPSSPTGGMLWMDTSGDTHVLKQYDTASDEWVEVASTYIKISATGIGTGLNEYDAADISGITCPASITDQKIAAQLTGMNASNIMYGCGDNYIIVMGLLSQTVSLDSGTVRVDRKVPDVDFVCESNNRLWGCKYGLENGVVVNEIRATKLGDFRNWQCFMGLSTDSYTASVGTDGAFTAAITQQGYPVFFKENCIHRVSGTTPSSFSITTTMCRGVQNGSWRSAAVVNEAIYYKSISGVMRYDGSLPECVSGNLGMDVWTDARAGDVDGKYYISMKIPGSTDVWSLYVYDTNRGLWHREDGTKALGFGRVGNELYFIDETANTLVSVNGSVGTAESGMSWSATLGMAGLDVVNQKYLSRFNIRMRMEAYSHVKIEIQYDSDGVWHDEGTIRRAAMTGTVMLPVIPRRCDHLQIRLSGSGDIVIYSFARVLEVGGDG